ALNQAIANAGNGASQEATAFKNANITAAINTDSTGAQQLTFNSSATAFQVQGGDQVATALLGNFATAGNPIGNVANVAATAGTSFTGALETGVKIRILGSGLNGAPANDLSVNLAVADTATTAAAKINTAIAANATVAATGIQATTDITGTKV